MKYSLSILLLVAYLLSFGQENTDWILQLSTSTDDSVVANANIQMGNNLVNKDPDSAGMYVHKGLVIALKLKNIPLLIAANNVLGNLHFFQSDYDSALIYYNQALLDSRLVKDTIREAAILNNLGSVYTYKSEYDTSIQILLQALEIREKMQDPKITSTYNNLGNAYLKMQDWDKSLKYYLLAADLKKRDNQLLSLSNTLNNIGIIKKNQNKFKEAIPYYQESLDIAIEFKDLYKQANAHNNLAVVYENVDRNKCEYHYQKAITHKRSLEDHAGLYNSLINYAFFLSTGGDQSKVLSLIEEANALEERIGTNFYLSESLITQSQALMNIGRTSQAYKVLKRAIETKVIEMNEDRNSKIADLEVKYETLKKEAQIQQLNHRQLLQELELTALKRNLILSITIGILLIGFTVIYIIMRNKKQRAERDAQEFQMEALKERFIELHASPSELAVNLEFRELNKKLNTPLTEREFEVIRLSLEGKTNTEISEKVFISTSTVKFHLRNAYNKIGVQNRKEAFQFMLKTS